MRARQSNYGIPTLSQTKNEQTLHIPKQGKA